MDSANKEQVLSASDFATEDYNKFLLTSLTVRSNIRKSPLVFGGGAGRPVPTLAKETPVRYDLIVIDCPPVLPVSDALVIGRLATGVIFVVKADHTPVPVARAGLRKLLSVDIPILGVVLNHHDFGRAARYYGAEYAAYGADSNERKERLKEARKALRARRATQRGRVPEVRP